MNRRLPRPARLLLRAAAAVVGIEQARVERDLAQTREFGEYLHLAPAVVALFGLARDLRAQHLLVRPIERALLAFEPGIDDRFPFFGQIGQDVCLPAP